MQYQYPDWWNYLPATLSGIQAKIEELPPFIEENKRRYQLNSAKKVQILADAKELWGEHTNVYKYLKKIPIAFPPDLLRPLECRKEELQKRIDKHNREEQEKQNTRAKEALIGEAVIWLLAQGKVQGVDFTGANAIKVADELAFQSLIKKYELSDEYIDFDGQNCDGPCKGWQPGNHRCYCGNRRVSWVCPEYHSFKNPAARAEAY